MGRTALSKKFKSGVHRKASPASAIGAEPYRLLLENLLSSGETFGKTESVAAYPLSEIRLVKEDGAIISPQNISVQPLYVVMDTSLYCNEYSRSLVLQDIMVSYARRLAGEADFNAPDYKGPGIWTSRKKAFEEDYIRREGKDEDGRTLHVYDPNPEASRLCIPLTADIVIPTAWGEYPASRGGMLTLREKDVPALADALLAIRSGKKTAQQALFKKDKNGKTVARFDIYAMEPGFAEENYKHVPPKESTRAVRAALGRPMPDKAPRLLK